MKFNIRLFPKKRKQPCCPFSVKAVKYAIKVLEEKARKLEEVYKDKEEKHTNLEREIAIAELRLVANAQLQLERAIEQAEKEELI